MRTDNGVKYNDYKTAYTNAGKFRCNSAQKDICKYCCCTTCKHAFTQKEKIPLPKCPKGKIDINRAIKQATDTPDCSQTSQCGLLHYRKWWERLDVDISVYGKRIGGVPIFIEENTLRVINDNYSYFIPLGKIDYIRTTDGLRSCQLSDKIDSKNDATATSDKKSSQSESCNSPQ